MRDGHTTITNNDATPRHAVTSMKSIERSDKIHNIIIRRRTALNRRP